MSELSTQQAEALGLPPGGPSAELSPQQAESLGLPSGGPGTNLAPSGKVNARDLLPPFARPGSPEFQAWLDSSPAGHDTVRQNLGQAAGLAGGMMMPEIPGVARAVSWLGKKLGAVADPLVERMSNAIGDKSAAALEKTASKAQGSYGKTVSEGSNLLSRLGKTEALEPAEQALNQAALGTPEAKELAAKLAGKARGSLPTQLGRIDTAKSLAESTAADAAAARTPQAINDAAAQMRNDAIKTLATRYVLPSAAGAATGFALGGDEHGLAGAATGGAMGLLHRPMMGFAARQIVKSPAFGLPIAQAMASTAEKLSSMAARQAPELGSRLGPILSSALREGPQSFAAHSYALSQQDPEFQDLQQKLAESK